MTHVKLGVDIIGMNIQMVLTVNLKYGSNDWITVDNF